MPIVSPKIPQGLEELMRGLAKSVIKENPENIYEFAAEYFENLLRERDGIVDQRYKKFATYKVYKKNKMARKQQQREAEAEVRSKPIELEQGSSSNFESIEKITLPDSTTQQHQPTRMHQLSVSSESEINTSVKQEAYIDDEGMPNNKSDANNDDGDIENMVLDEEMEQAALKIQSTFRGHKVRREGIETKSQLQTTITDKAASEKGSITEEENLACNVGEIESEIVVENESGHDDEPGHKLSIECIEADEQEQQNDPNQSSLDGENVVRNEDEKGVASATLECNEKTLADDVEKISEGSGDVKELIESNESDVMPEIPIANEKQESNEETLSGDLMALGGEGEGENAGQEGIVDVMDAETTDIRAGSKKEIETIRSDGMEKCEQKEISLPLKSDSVEIEANELDQQETTTTMGDMDDEIANMVLDDEMEEAALKIQSAFRGQRIRRDVKNEEIDVVENENLPTKHDANTNDEKSISHHSEIDDQDLIENSTKAPEKIGLKGENDEAASEKFESLEKEEGNKCGNHENQQPEEIEGGIVNNVEQEQQEEEVGDELLEQMDSIENNKIDNTSIKSNDEILMNEAIQEKADAVEALNENETFANNEIPLAVTDGDKIIMPTTMDESSNDANVEEVKVHNEQAPERSENTNSVEARDDGYEDNNNDGGITVENETKSDIVGISTEENEQEITPIKNSEESQANQEGDGEGKSEGENGENVLTIESEMDNEKMLPVEIPTENESVIEGADVPKGDETCAKDEVKSSVDNTTPHASINSSNTENDEKILESGGEATGFIECQEKEEDLNIIASMSASEMNDESNQEQQQQLNEIMEKVAENNNNNAITEELQETGERKCEIEGDEQEMTITEVNEGEKEALTNDDKYDRQISVEEESCEQKFVANLQPEQHDSVAIDDILDENIAADDKFPSEQDTKTSLERMSSTEIKYEKLHESVDGKLSPLSIERQETEEEGEKSIDEDSVVDSKHVSAEDIDNDNDADRKSNKSVEKETIKLEKFLQQSISPADLIDEVVNEVASSKANEIFNTTTAAADLEQISQPELIKLNTLETEQPENDAPNDEILKPETEESEIPEETSTPVDETLEVIQDNNTPIENKIEPEIIEKESDEIPTPVTEENVEDMILDGEMENAAIKIQATFRGHKSRKGTTSTIKSDSQITNKDEGEEQENESDRNEDNSNIIVIDQCSEANGETQDQENGDQEDTSADIEEIQESEETAGQQNDEQEDQGQEEEEATTEVEEEEKTSDETENETETNEGEGGNDEPEGEGEQAEGGEAQNNDDDDVANMVLDDEMEQAALKIQSTFRGHKTRKEVKSKQDGETKVDESNTIDNVDDEIANMVLDEEMEQAALKIQSTFRGHKVRKDTKKADDGENANEEESEEAEKEEEKKENEPPKEEEPVASSSTEKTAQQLQEEEDIANLVMDDEMEKTALKIQSAFRGKIKRKPKDDMESVESSAEDGSNYEGDDDDKKNTDESLQKSDESPPSDMYDYFGMSANENASDERGNSYEEADYNNFATSRQSSYSADDHFDVIEQRYNETIYPDDDINLMQGGGIFVEASRDSQSGAMCASSDEDKEPNDDLNGKNNGEKISSNVNNNVEELDEEAKKNEKLGKISEEKVIESFDFEQNKDTAEALYYSLKKSEIEAQKRFKGDSEGPLLEEEYTEVEHKNESLENEDDDDVVMLKSPSATAKILKYGMSMDDRLLGSILSQDYSQKPRKIYPDDGFDPLLEETMRCHPQFLQRLHEMSQSGEAEIYDDNVGDDEDQFDDFYPGNIRAKIMASSISIADSFDCFDPTNNKSIIDDDTIRTALETIHSTDSESTIASAATKIQAGERGHTFTARRNNNQYSSIGNAAIDKSLDDFIQSQELRVDRFDEEPETSPPASRIQESNDDTWTSDTCTESDKKLPMPGIIGIKLEQKQLSHFLTIDERRRTLQREDAIQRNSTRSQEEDSSKSSSSEKIIDKANLQSDDAIVTSVGGSGGGGVQGQSSIIDTEIVVPVLEKQTTKSSSNIHKTVKVPIIRQKTMPVQIESSVMRVLPKHLRKRIKSAESSDKKRKISKN